MITGTYAALLALLLLVLSALVIRQRLRHRTAIGLGSAEGLLRASRAHANFAEYVPFALLLMLLLEQGAAPAWLLHALGLALLLGRLSHAYGISRMPERLLFRQVGMLCTFGVLGVAAVAMLVR